MCLGVIAHGMHRCTEVRTPSSTPPQASIHAAASRTTCCHISNPTAPQLAHYDTANPKSKSPHRKPKVKITAPENNSMQHSPITGSRADANMMAKHGRASIHSALPSPDSSSMSPPRSVSPEWPNCQRRLLPPFSLFPPFPGFPGFDPLLCFPAALPPP